MREEQFEYDVQKRARAGTAATLRAVVSAYIIYIGWNILKGVRDGSSPIPAWAGWLIAFAFIAAALAFAFFTWKTWRRDLAAARLPTEVKAEGLTDGGEAEEHEK